MTTEPTDEELEQYMSEDTPLSQRYRGSHAEMPPDRLDSHILAAATAQRDARIENRRQHVKRPGWTIPLSIAAIMVLSVSLVTTMQQQSPEPVPMSVIDEMEVESTSAGASVKMSESSPPGPASDMSSFEQKSAEQISPAENTRLEKAPQRATPSKTPLPGESVDLMQDYKADTLATEPGLQAETDAAATSSLKQKSLTDDEATLIRKLGELISGDEVDKARQVMRDFRKANPTYSDAAIIELIGKDWYQVLLTQ